MTFNSNTSSTWQPSGDYRLDWDLTGSDGSAALVSATGNQNVSVSVSTPGNGDGDSFAMADGKLHSASVQNPTQTIIDFGAAVTDVNFQIEDVDQDNNWLLSETWDDKVTVLAYDADGNLVDVDFSFASDSGITATGNSVEGGKNIDGGLSGESTRDNVTVSVAGPITKLVIIHDNGASDKDSGWVKITDMGFNAVPDAASLDGIVEGTDGADVIDASYTGDPDGDMVDNNDAVLPGEFGNDDIIYGFGGDDVIKAGAGYDEIYAGGGDDYVEGSSGNDVIHGDMETRDGNVPTETREVFKWDAAPGYADEKDTAGFTQNTGSVNVTMSVVSKSSDAQVEFENDAGNVSGLDAGADAKSGLALEGDDKYDDAKIQLAFDQDVTDVSFRINDIDQCSSVKVWAYVDGKAVEVDLTGGTKVGVSGNVATAKASDAPATADQNSLLVKIAGPVDKIVVEHDITGSSTSHVQLTDVYFTATTEGDCLPDEAGNDTLLGMNGDDIIYGEGGDDTIDGGAGNDVLYGDHGLVNGTPAPTMVRESFNWTKPAGSDAQDFAQNTGNVDVSFKIVSEDAGVTSSYAADAQNVSGIDSGSETINAKQSFYSETGGQGRDASYELSFSNAVENVAFRVNDVDGDGLVTIKAYDADGNQIAVQLTGGSKVTLKDTDGTLGKDTIDSNGGYLEDTAAEYSTLVQIAGPVAKIVIDHAQNGPNNSGINVTDVYFDVADGAACEPDDEGNDTITGGAGADLMYGEGGNDTFVVASGEDGAGDTVIGGNGPVQTTDRDVLDLTGAGRVTIDQTADDSDAGAFKGTVTFSNGKVLTFSQIEEIVTDPQNTNPDAVDDSASVDEDGSVVVPVLANDSDPEGDTLTVDSFTQGSNGTVSQNPDGTLTYTPNTDFNGQDSFTYTVTDGNGGTDTATVTVDVGAQNDAPDAVDDTIMVDEDSSVDIPVLANDSDPEGDTLTVGSFTQGANGTVSQNPDGTLKYTPNADFNGQDSFSYTVTDGNGGTDTATVTVDVCPKNDAPDAVDDVTSTDPGVPVTLNLLANDTDIDGDPLEVLKATGPANGTISGNADGTFTYTPNAGFEGTDSFTYTITDGHGGQDTATVLISVGDGNLPPDAVEDTASTTEGTPVTVDVLANDSDPDGDAISIDSFTNGTNGTVSQDGDGNLVYTPNDGFTGPDSFTYTITDGAGNQDTATVSVDVGAAPNSNPDAVDDTASTIAGTPVTFNVLANDTDPENDPLQITQLIGAPANGTLTAGANPGEFIYTPNAGFIGTESFSYTISDGNGGTDTASVTIDVTPNGNNAVVAKDDALDIDEDTSIIVDLTDNDFDPQGDSFSVTALGTPANGTATLLADGTVQYTPDPDFFGTDSFTYTITDIYGATDTATVTVNVDPVNDDPNADDDVVVIEQDSPVVIDVIANDSDPDGDPLEVLDYTQPSNGTVTANPDGTLTYTPEAGYIGTDTFEYTVTDGNGGTDTATVSIGVQPDDENTTDAVDDTATTSPGTAVEIDVLANDTDPEGDAISVISSTQPANGTVTNVDGVFTYTPNAGFTGVDTFTYTIDDAQGATDTATVTVRVMEGGQNTVSAVDDAATVDEDTSVIVDVLANDSDPEGDSFDLIAVGTPSNGTAELLPNGTVKYTPNADYFGTDTFTYTIEDQFGATDTATVTVTVDPVNEVDAVDDTASTAANTPVAIDVLANDTDPEGDAISVIGSTPPANGTISLAGGVFTYTPNAGFTGTDTFTYTIDDALGATDIATVTVSVGMTGPNTVDAVDDAYDTDEDTALIVDVTSNDLDPQGDPITVTALGTPTNGTAELLSDGTVKYTPNADFFGTDSFTYTVTDGNGATDVATVTVTVDPVNDNPDSEDDLVVTEGGDPVVIPVLDNDSDPDGDPLDIIDIGTPTNGTVTQNDDGTVTYDPNDGFTGTDTFTYTISDGNGGTDTSTVTVVVNPEPGQNANPDAVDDTARTPINTPIVLAVLANDSDPDGDPLSVIDAQSSFGTPTINADGTITFTPATDVTGPATVTYTVSDGNGGTDTATVSLMINDGIVEGTTGNDVIDTSYTGDPEGDLVDAGDNIFPDKGPNDDIIEAYEGDDIIRAGDGDDEIYGGDGNDVAYGGDGDDYIDTRAPTEASDHGFVPGETVDNWPFGPLTPNDLVPKDTDPYNDMDVVYGGAGNDTILTGDDADVVYGGDGDDTIDGGLDDDTLKGDAGDDYIIGGHGADVIDGGDGDDEIWGGLGPNTPDILDLEDDAYPVNDYGDADSNDPDSVTPTFLDPRPENGKDIIHGGAGNDVIYGQDDDDVLFGDEGDDYIDGGIDDDTIFGGDGDDELYGGKGQDYIDGGAGNDTMDGGDDRDYFVNVNAGDVVDGGEGGDDFDTLDLTGSAPVGGSLIVTKDPSNVENGMVEFFDDQGNSVGTMEFFNIEDVVPCFTPGTLIATPKGEVPVEELREGDRVITRDNGIQDIAWVGHKALDWRALHSSQHLKPVLIKAGALGPNLPERDMMVSPNHRMLVANERTTLYFDEREVLASAKHLVDNEGVMQVDVKSLTYVHFMFEKHEVVLADGTWSESFQPGDHSLKGVGNAQRQELFELFPELETREGIDDYVAARRILKKHEAQMLVKK
ncbi:Ig-like domain-containing protein [Maritimibacter sp. DP1N21-5]|uniref:Ig-like domain-containing protein n=1 Tax=Maritimibacter sp. DP1N21-5 TaxID=2836867 RepID=UPI001C4675DE|nr:Ig-like domain-containing protein [Maritimibacter sp. DP1N21-5]MBV7409941.1 tandem-95 repeat protein [Maritimibacter sp. DP1N21-5]